MTATAVTKPKQYNWDGFTDKERIFCYEYLIDQNGKEAAIRAGYSPKTAVKMAYQLKQTPRVAARLDEMLADKITKLDITSDMIMQELAVIGFMKLDQVIAAAPPRSDEEESGPAPVTLLSTMRVNDKKGALELMGKNLKMWTDKVEVNERPKVFIRDFTGRNKQQD